MRDYHTDASQQFQCELCDKEFRNRGLLINHKSEKHRDAMMAGGQSWNPV